MKLIKAIIILHKYRNEPDVLEMLQMLEPLKTVMKYPRLFTVLIELGII